MIEEAIFARLAAWPGLAARVGNKVYPLHAPQNIAPPFVTYQRISSPRLRSLRGSSGQANPRIQVDVYAASYAETKALSEQVRLALDNFRGDVFTAAAGVITIRACSLESDRDLIDPDVDPALFRVSHDFLLWHDE